jgi:hypothetical protein
MKQILLSKKGQHMLLVRSYKIYIKKFEIFLSVCYLIYIISTEKVKIKIKKKLEGMRVSVKSRMLFTPGKDPVSNIQEAGRAPASVWTGAENLATTGIRSPDRPVRSQ